MEHFRTFTSFNFEIVFIKVRSDIGQVVELLRKDAFSGTVHFDYWNFTKVSSKYGPVFELYLSNARADKGTEAPKILRFSSVSPLDISAERQDNWCNTYGSNYMLIQGSFIN